MEKKKGLSDQLVDMTALTDTDLDEGFGGSQPSSTTSSVNSSLIKRSVAF